MKWENVDGAQVMRIWEDEGKDVWPQISVMRVSNATYLKFSQDPKGFMNLVNKHKVFSKDVIAVGPWVSLSSVDAKDDSAGWDLIMVHKPISQAIVAAVRP